MAKGSAVPRSSGLVTVALFINCVAGVTDCGTKKLTGCLWNRNLGKLQNNLKNFQTDATAVSSKQRGVMR